MKNPNDNCSCDNGSSKNDSCNERLLFATQLLDKHDIEYSLKNEQSGHLHCRRKSDDKLIQFWAGTGTIMGYDERGVHNLIKLLTECVTSSKLNI